MDMTNDLILDSPVTFLAVHIINFTVTKSVLSILNLVSCSRILSGGHDDQHVSNFNPPMCILILISLLVNEVYYILLRSCHSIYGIGKMPISYCSASLYYPCLCRSFSRASDTIRWRRY